MKKRKWTRNKLFNVFLSVPLISLPALGLVSCGDKTTQTDNKGTEKKEPDKKANKNAWKEEKIDVTYNSHKYKINYLEETPNPDKQVILFLHGLAGNWHEFESLLDVKDRNYTMIALDFPGSTGDSSYNKDTDDTISMVMYAGITKEFIKAKKLKDIVLFGHSLGGGIAPLVMQDTTLSIKKGLLLAPLNPYAVSIFIAKLKSSAEQEERNVGTKLENILDTLDKDKKDTQKTPSEVLDTAYNSIFNLYDSLDKGSWYASNISQLVLAFTIVRFDPNHTNYYMTVNEILDRNFAKTTLLDAFTESKDKLAIISGKEDHTIVFDSVQLLHDNLGIPVTGEDNFSHTPQDNPASWDKVKKFIYDQVAALK